MPVDPLTRRAFLGSALALGASLLLGSPLHGARRTVRVGAVLPGSGPLAALAREGVELAAEEASRTAELVGARFHLSLAEAEDPTKAAREARKLVDQGALVLLGGLDQESRQALEKVARQRRVAFLSLAPPDLSERKSPYVFHVPAGLETRIEALAHGVVRDLGLRRWRFAIPPTEEGRQIAELGYQALRRQGGLDVGKDELDPAAPDLAAWRRAMTATRPEFVLLGFRREDLGLFIETTRPPKLPRMGGPYYPTSNPGFGIWCGEWSPTLRRYGAEQLNRRYQARFEQPMGSAAWLGWMAVKMAAELALRHPGVGRATLATRLAGMAFDGHKGMPLAFDPEDHHLRQPVYLVGREKPPGPLSVLSEMTPEEE